jgi:hypothetical protein
MRTDSGQYFKVQLQLRKNSKYVLEHSIFLLQVFTEDCCNSHSINHDIITFIHLMLRLMHEAFVNMASSQPEIGKRHPGLELCSAPRYFSARPTPNRLADAKGYQQTKKFSRSRLTVFHMSNSIASRLLPVSAAYYYIQLKITK